MLETVNATNVEIKSMDNLFDYCDNEAINLIYQKHNNDFHFRHDSKIYGIGNNYNTITNGCSFTKEGIKSLFANMGIPSLYQTLDSVTTRNVASDFLNKLLQEFKVKDRLKNKKFIIDQTNGYPSQEPKIIGMVSDLYKPYTNKQLLDSFMKSELMETLEFERAWSHNTLLTINWLDREYTGIEIDGKLDRSRIGLYSRNSMVGNSTIKLDVSLFDMLCTNGMMIKNNLSKSSIVHKGKYIPTYQIQKMITDSKTVYSQAIDRLKLTLDIPFDIKTATIMLASEAPVHLIKDDKIPLWNTQKVYKTEKEGQEALMTSVKHIMETPKRIGGIHTNKVFESSHRDGKASVYHYIGAFTEYAQTRSPAEQYRIEEEAGDLVNWFGVNKRRFLN